MRTATLRNFARPGPCRPARRNPLRRTLAHRRKGGPGVRGIVGRDHSSLRRLRRQHPRPHHAKSGAARLVWTPPVMQAFWRARCVKYIHVSRRLCRPRTAIRGPGQSSVAHKKCSWFTRDRSPLLSLRPCPRRPAQALTPGNPSVGSRRDRRHPLLLRQQRPSGAHRWPSHRHQLRRLGRERQPRRTPLRPPNNRHGVDALSR